MALMCLPLCYGPSAVGGAGSPDDRHSPANVITAVSDSGVICVIIDVSSSSFQVGETEVQGKQITCPGKELDWDLNPDSVLLGLFWSVSFSRCHCPLHVLGSLGSSPPVVDTPDFSSCQTRLKGSKIKALQLPNQPALHLRPLFPLVAAPSKEGIPSSHCPWRNGQG